MAETARSAYDVRVVDPARGKLATRGLVVRIAELFAVGGDGDGPRTYLRVEVVDRQSVVVRTWEELPVTASGLTAEIEADLDRMDPAAFAAKWNLGTAPRT